MRNYELLVLNCKMCKWHWEISSQEQTHEIICEQCGSSDISIEKEILHMHKQGGKFITDIGFASPHDKFGVDHSEELADTYEKPLLVIKDNTINLSEEMTNEERISILGKINALKSRLLQEIKESQDTSFINL